MTKATPSRHDGNLNNAQKKAICEEKRRNGKATNKELAEWSRTQLNLAVTPSESTISRTLSKSDYYLAIAPEDHEIRRKRVVVHQQIEDALVTWVLQLQHRNIAVGRAQIREQAHRFATLLNINTTMKFSENWVTLFNNRNGFGHRRTHGESGTADLNTPTVQETLARIREKAKNFAPEDIWNFDETALFYNMPPDTTIARYQLQGRGKDKTRFTIGFICNSTGTDIFRPLFIAYAAKPRCFGGKSGQELGFLYFNNQKAWMTSIIFREYLRAFDHYVNRPVYLLLDNASCHNVFESLNLKNISYDFLPPNTTSKLQPLDQGIIACFKKRYRKKQISWGLDQLEIGANPYKIDQLQAMRWSVAIWRGIEPVIISNCWRHTRLLDDSSMYVEMGIESQNDSEFEADYAQFIANAGIQKAMDSEHFLSPIEEDIQHTTEELTDEEIVTLVQPVEEEREEKEEMEISPYLVMEKKQKVIALAQVIALVENLENPSETQKRLQEDVVHYLRRMQGDIRREMAVEKQKGIQTCITDYFIH
jgi:hypothetical protein